MTIKEKVLASCKTSFAKYGLKKDELAKLVDLIVASRGLTDESTDENVTEAITAVEPYVGMMQAAFNRAVSETTKKYEGWVDPKATPTPPTNPPAPPVPPTTETPLTAEAVAKMIAEVKNDQQKAVNEAVAAALAPYKEREERTRLATLLQSNEKLKNVPEVFRSRYQLDKEENLDSVVEQINNDFTEMKQKLVADGIFVSAPTTSTPQSEQDDFIKRMEGFAQRNAPEPEGAS
ncbi:hypothetical protein [Leyella stercorea]|uniref:hypothetical protein n=1 Tax=Leyella stercorea TaxID=363265 RepID=UPI00266D93E1|nr:hypothetical protein [Leyella stercorea]